MSSIPEPSIPNLEFTKISSFVSLYTPPTLPSAASKTDPTTIIFCQWMGASPRSRSLHTAYHRYHALYPAARIVLVRSTPEWFTTTSNSARQKQLAPALSAIESDPAGDKKRVLVHLFSNGGGVAFHEICILYKERFDRRLPVKAFILDSAPGSPTAMEAWAAMRVGLPKGFLWYPAAAFIWTIIGLIWVQTRVMKIDALVDHMRHGLLEFDIMDKAAKRLYIYSLSDPIIGYKGVDEQVAKAREMGIDARVLKEENTPHVQHMAKEPERYWKNIEELWESTRGG